VNAEPHNSIDLLCVPPAMRRGHGEPDSEHGPTAGNCARGNPVRSDPAPWGAEAAASASSLIEHIQGVMEHQKALLARDLHDELGGLLVGAVMDLAWAEQHMTAPPAELKQKLVRARQALAAAIDMKRKLIEELRPTLLDNVGLFAALRWHVQAACKRAGATCIIDVPEEERRFLPNVPIALFRIVQEALAVIVARKPVASAEFKVTVDPQAVAIVIRGDAAGQPSEEDAGVGTDVQYLSAIRHRVGLMKGEFQHDYVPAVGTRIAFRFPIEHTMLPG
jgi:signal transduction histidine kinase